MPLLSFFPTLISFGYQKNTQHGKKATSTPWRLARLRFRDFFDKWSLSVQWELGLKVRKGGEKWAFFEGFIKGFRSTILKLDVILPRKLGIQTPLLTCKNRTLDCRASGWFSTLMCLALFCTTLKLCQPPTIQPSLCCCRLVWKCKVQFFEWSPINVSSPERGLLQLEW